MHPGTREERPRVDVEREVDAAGRREELSRLGRFELVLTHDVDLEGRLELKRPLPRKGGLRKSCKGFKDEREFEQLQRTLTQLGG